MLDSVQNQLQHCLNEVNTDPDHDLSPKARRLLLEAINDEVQGDYNGPIKISRAHYVRTQLAIMCVKKILPLWEKNIDVKHPHRIIDESEAYLKGEFSYDDLTKDVMGFYGGLANAESDEELIAYPVGRAAAGAGIVARHDDNLLEEGLLLVACPHKPIVFII